MGLRGSTKYDAILDFIRIMPLNDDLQPPTTTRMVGGTGTFDFSGETDPSAVPLSIKIDDGAVETKNIDVSTGTGSVDESKVTVAELVTAITTAAFTDVTATSEVGTGRIKLAYSGAGTPKYIQVYGRAAEVALFGQGRGLQFRKTDNIEAATESITRKEQEEITETSSTGLDNTIISDGYRKSITQEWTDESADYDFRSIIEGGTIDATTGTYTVPTSQSRPIYFFAELFWRNYNEGDSKEADIKGYTQQILHSCKGTFGDRSYNREWVKWVYSIVGTTYKDLSGNLIADSVEIPLTKEAYAALNVKAV
ncbi:MAG: hypothetical protein OEV44_01350 [Spirochaetota bacterium]|nr:hypothetical protein [Spirochaetota bacterium]